MTTTDVQLFAAGVLLEFDGIDSGNAASGPKALMFSIDHPTFDNLANQCAEAALAKRGREEHSVPAGEVQIGDYMLGREVVNVRPNHPAWGLTSLNLGDPFGYVLLDTDGLVKVERKIS